MAEFQPKSREELARLDSKDAALPTGAVQSLHNELLQRVSDMGFSPKDLDQVPETVRAMTVADLNDFSRKMAGVPQNNPVVNRLTIKDIQGIEFLFGTAKNAALSRVAASGADLAAVDIDVSCCCCTPCCCCAAADVEPFAA